MLRLQSRRKPRVVPDSTWRWFLVKNHESASLTLSRARSRDLNGRMSRVNLLICDAVSWRHSLAGVVTSQWTLIRPRMRDLIAGCHFRSVILSQAKSATTLMEDGYCACAWRVCVWSRDNSLFHPQYCCGSVIEDRGQSTTVRDFKSRRQGFHTGGRGADWGCCGASH